MKKNLLFFLCSFLVANAIPSSPVEFGVTIDRTDIRPGEYIHLYFDIQVDKDFFIYSTDPDQSLSPTKVIWIDSTMFIDSTIFNEPNPKIKYDKNFEMDVGYHTGDIKLDQYFLTSENITGNETGLSYGNKSLNGKLFYQACDPTQCIQYYDDFSINIHIVDEPKRDQYLFPISDFDQWTSKGLISFIIFSFTMGLFALLTPCVFPMIPITVSFFTKQGELENNNPLKSAIIYVLGIIAIFTSLGLILSLILGGDAISKVAQNPFINIFIGLLFIFFAFSLFGMYEIEVPSAFRQFSLQNEQRSGAIGILFMALTFTLASFTCTVQFVGATLVAATKGAYWFSTIGMIVFSLAFALPFFFLALFPQYLSKLPRSGQWMNSIKVTMGFLEVGAAMKFLSNADMVWEIGILDYYLVLSSWAILSLLTGIYLLGKIKLPHDSELKTIGVPRLTISTLFLIIGLYLSSGVFGTPMHGLIDSYLPDKPHQKEEISNNNKSIFNKESQEWFEDYNMAINESLKTEKPIFIDFTGVTCTNCRWMEVNIFNDPEVENLFEYFILTKLYTDKGPKRKEYSKMKMDKYKTAALPYYVVIDSNENTLNTFHGMDTDVNKFINFLKKSLNKFNEDI